MLAGDKPLLHGGDLVAAIARHPEAPQPWVDLSTGISPFAYRVGKIADDAWRRLPGRCALDGLLDAAARRYRVHAESDSQIVAAPGTQAIIQVLPRLFAPGKVAILGPTYREHAHCWALGGHEILEVDDLSQALAAHADTVVVVNPNNPTGRIYSAPQLVETARALAQRNGQLVVDEAFCDFCGDDASVIPSAPANVVVMRSFGKTYGLAGLRLGFAIAAPELARGLRAVLGPWAISGAAIDIGRRALDDAAWFGTARGRALEASRRLCDVLCAGGFEIVGHTPLFVLGAHRDAAAAHDHLGERGIHVRHFPDAPTWLRFGLPDDDASWQRLEDALCHKS